jgi:hypothetical protein
MTIDKELARFITWALPIVLDSIFMVYICMFEEGQGAEFETFLLFSEIITWKSI